MHPYTVFPSFSARVGQIAILLNFSSGGVPIVTVRITDLEELFHDNNIEEEFRRITLKPLQSTFFGKLDEYTPKLLRLYRRTGGAVCDDDDAAAIQEAITSFVLDIFVVSKARDGGLEKQAGIAIEGAENRIYGAEVEMKVRPGDNITLYCDRSVTIGFRFVWIRNCSHENQPSLVIDFRKWGLEIFQHFSFIYNRSSNSHDLHITNISVSDLGLYYCAEVENKVNYEKGFISSSEVYYYGNRTTRLSLTESVSPHAEQFNITSTLPLDCVLCWTLLFSVCPVCVLLSSLLSSICVYCLCRAQTAEIEHKLKIKKAPSSHLKCTILETEQLVSLLQRLCSLLDAAVQCVSGVCSPLLTPVLHVCVLPLSGSVCRRLRVGASSQLNVDRVIRTPRYDLKGKRSEDDMDG
ncbi:unnamed protein product [Leuciscus chuanchicus]